MVDPAVGIADPEVLALAGVAATIQSEHVRADQDPWAGSPFAWIRREPSRTRGAIGERLVAGWCAAKGADVVRAGDSEADRVVNGHRVEIKLSTLWSGGTYRFQQIRDQSYAYVIALGISPFDAHCWVLPKSVLLAHVIGRLGQHTGASGRDTAWIEVDARRPVSWMRPYGGSLAEAWAVLAALGRA